jgi:hypothetical protein
MCGPSNAQQQLSSEQSNFFNQLTQSYAQNFGEQQGVLNSLNSALSPILEAGPNQMGFSAAENAALTGGAISTSAENARNAQVVAASSEGGNTGVTTGGEKQLQAQIASNAGVGLSGEENQINLANAATGRQNFFNAEAGLAGVAGMENPVPTAGVANNAGGTAFGEATTIQNMRNQEQSDIGGAVAGLALAPFTGGMSLGMMGGLLGGGGSGGGGSMTQSGAGSDVEFS